MFNQKPISENYNYQDYSENQNKRKFVQKIKSVGIDSEENKENYLRSSSDFYTNFNNQARSSKSLGFQVNQDVNWAMLEKQEQYKPSLPMHKKSQSTQLKYELLSELNAEK